MQPQEIGCQTAYRLYTVWIWILTWIGRSFHTSVKQVPVQRPTPFPLYCSATAGLPAPAHGQAAATASHRHFASPGASIAVLLDVADCRSVCFHTFLHQRRIKISSGCADRNDSETLDCWRHRFRERTAWSELAAAVTDPSGLVWSAGGRSFASRVPSKILHSFVSEIPASSGARSRRISTV